MRGFKIAMLILVVSSPALAKERTSSKPYDPNRVVCKTEGLIGSRLQQKRTCLTVTQWQDLNREVRTTVDKVQAFKPNVG